MRLERGKTQVFHPVYRDSNPMNRRKSIQAPLTVVKFDQVLGSLKRLMRRGAISNVAKIVNRMHPADLGRIFRNLEDHEKTHLFGLIKDTHTRSHLIGEMDEGSRRVVLDALPTYEIVEILKELDRDDQADILGDMSEVKAREVLSLMEAPEAQEVEALLKYPEETAGGIMTTRFFALREDTTVEEAIKKLQESEDVEMVFYIYVVDAEDHLVGVLSLRHLLMVPPHTRLRDIMETHVIRVDTDMDQEEVARMVARYDLLAVPVVDRENRLVGIVTVDDVIDVIREEATEDMLKMAGTEDEEYVFTSSPLRVAGLRIPWLLTAVLGELVSGGVLWYFRATLEQVIALATFVPLIMAMGGNAGLQSSTIVIRGLATGRVEVTNVWRVLFREIRVALVIGLLGGGLVGVLAPLWHGNPMLGVVVGVSLLVAILVAAAMGTLVPLLLKWMKIDPAVASGPFVTTANDITGITIYLTLATMLLQSLK